METTFLLSTAFIQSSSTATSFVIMTICSGILLWVVPKCHRYHIFKMETYFHELCHGLASLATGGSFHKFHVHSGGGECLTSGGNRYVVITAGYIGVILSGTILLAKSTDCFLAVGLLQALAIIFALSTLKAGDLHTVAIGVVVSAILGFCSILYPNAFLTRFLMNFLGIILIWQGIQSLKILLFVSASDKNTNSDAKSLSNLIKKHPFTCALIICCIAFVPLLILFAYIF